MQLMNVNRHWFYDEQILLGDLLETSSLSNWITVFFFSSYPCLSDCRLDLDAQNILQMNFRFLIHFIYRLCIRYDDLLWTSLFFWYDLFI